MSFKYTVSSELTKQKETPRLGKQVYGCWGDGSGEELVREFGMDRYTLLYFKWITNKDLLHSNMELYSCYVAAWMAGWCLKENGYMHMHKQGPLLLT